MLRSAYLAGALTAIVGLTCAKAPPSTAIPYDGSVGTGPEWNTSVDHVELTVDPAKGARSISPLIYGYNGVANPARYGVASLRAGGNRFSAYNWENNASNAGRDANFQSDSYLVQRSAMPDVPGEAVRPMLQTAHDIGAGAVVTVPIGDYVAADKLGDGDVTAGADYLDTRFKQNRPTRGTGIAFSIPDITDAFVYQDEFVEWVVEQYPEIPLLFSLDNEPDLWSQTHKEIHPLPVTYDEVVTRNQDYARAIKAVWPWAPVLGFVSYGWQGYVTLNHAPDSGKGDFIKYYLEKMKEAEDAQDGIRLIDYLDLHWYPEAQGMGAAGPIRIVFGGNDNSPGVVEARLQAPRSLWDPGYREQSWIANDVSGPIALIPRMQQKIEAAYPGTKLAVTEWSYGGSGDISGGVATADVLGIFGREGVGMANIWPIGSGQFPLAAISVFRNFDGAGSRFGDTSVSAQTTSIFSSSVYASTDTTNPARTVIVAINKRNAPTSATIRIVGDSSSDNAAVWVLAGSTPTVQAAAPLTTTTPGTFSYDMPPLSVTVLVPSMGPPPPPPVDAGPDAGSDGATEAL